MQRYLQRFYHSALTQLTWNLSSVFAQSVWVLTLHGLKWWGWRLYVCMSTESPPNEKKYVFERKYLRALLGLYRFDLCKKTDQKIPCKCAFTILYGQGQISGCAACCVRLWWSPVRRGWWAGCCRSSPPLLLSSPPAIETEPSCTTSSVSSGYTHRTITPVYTNNV
jgi:hypothetical protein